MLNKAALKAVPTPFPQSNWLDLIEQAPNIHYYAAAQVKVIDHQQTLILDMYTYNDLRNKQKATYRVFLTAKDDLTLYHSADGCSKWLTSQLSRLLNDDICIFLDIASLEAVNRFFKPKPQAILNAPLKEDLYNHYDKLKRSPQLHMIFAWQRYLRQKRLKKRHQKECHQIDQLMRAIRPLPKAFFQWLEDDVLLHSRYIYYQYKPHKVLDGFCTHCLQDVQVTGAKHNKSGICPHCGSPITFKAIGRAQHIVDQAYVTYFQKIENGFVIRYFSVTKSYDAHYRQPELIIHEMARTFYDNDVEKEKYFYWGNYKNTDVYRWCLTPNRRTNFGYPRIYDKNLATVLQNTPYRYCAMDRYIAHEPCFMPYRYLKIYKWCPGLEYLVKAKLFRLVDHFMEYMLPKQLQNTEAKSLTELLCVDQYYLNKMIETDATPKEYEIYMVLSQQQIYLNDRQLAFVMANFTAYNLSSFIDFLRTTPRPIKTLHYLIRSAKLSENKVFNVASDWKDYLILCQRLHYDLTLERILYPKNLHTAHLEVVTLYKAQENAIYDRCLAERYSYDLERYHYENEQFLIEVPRSHADLINESAALFHCVEQYTPRIVEQKCVILFLRKRSAPTQPFYTIEIRQNHIMQCRTTHNKTAKAQGDNDVLDFLEQFEENVLKPKIAMAA